MREFSKSGVLLFAAAMAVGAFAIPSMASASSWGGIGSEHTLDSPNFGFINDQIDVTSECSRSQFTASIVSAAVMEITTGSLSGCTVVGAGIGTCTATSLATNFPWTATAVSTSNIQIHGAIIRVFFENHPGSTACLAASATLRVTGTLSGATWTGNASHAMDINGGTGPVSHSPFGNNLPITLTGRISDTQGTLTVTN